MPIRTPKGRGAAYRPLWQWPLRSPSRLIGCAIVLISLIVIGNSLLGRVSLGSLGGSHAAGTAQGPASTPAVPAQPTRLPPVPALTPRRLPDSAAPPAALSTALAWTRAWAHHPAGITSASWAAGLRPYTTDEYLGVLSSVDPSNVPASRVTGAPRAVLVAPSSVRVEVPTDAVELVVLVVDTADPGQPAVWRVAGYDRADSVG